jgi:hypothetical protein
MGREEGGQKKRKENDCAEFCYSLIYYVVPSVEMQR